MTDFSGRPILLLQIRKDRFELDVERRAVLRSTGLGSDSFRIRNAYDLGRIGTALLDGASALMVGGSISSVHDPDLPDGEGMAELVRTAVGRGLPIMGLCFGAQLLADALGGEVIRDFERRERGTYDLTLGGAAGRDPLFSGLPGTFPIQCSHQDRIVRLPEGAVLLASTELCPVQAFRLGDGPQYGLQFHPERSRADFEELYDAKIADYGENGERVGFRSPLRDTPEAESLLVRFVGLVGSRT